MRPSIRTLLLLFAILLSSRATLADACVVECMRMFSCNRPPAGVPGPDCSQQYSHQTHLCEISCRGKNGNSEPTTGWGSIAYSAKEHAYGYAYLKQSKADAEQVAMQNCNQRASGCSIRIDFYNSCGAVASSGDTVGAGTASTKAGAEQKAVAACASNGGRQCTPESSVCSGASAASTTPDAPRAVSWGAIAYSNKDSGSGWAQGKGDKPAAEREALNACAQRGRNCSILTSFNKQCGAVAADREFFGWGTHDDQRTAQQRALDECKKDGGARCALRISFCSY